eukprot:m.33253 g.33253  ORF g.33253 m.33253 type:complete len:256 (+) comp16785_c0_seq1:288-1055(+)
MSHALVFGRLTISMSSASPDSDMEDPFKMEKHDQIEDLDDSDDEATDDKSTKRKFEDSDNEDVDKRFPTDNKDLVDPVQEISTSTKRKFESSDDSDDLYSLIDPNTKNETSMLTSTRRNRRLRRLRDPDSDDEDLDKCFPTDDKDLNVIVQETSTSAKRKCLDSSNDKDGPPLQQEQEESNSNDEDRPDPLQQEQKASSSEDKILAKRFPKCARHPHGGAKCATCMMSGHTVASWSTLKKNCPPWMQFPIDRPMY